MVWKGQEADLGLAPRFLDCGSRDGDRDGTVDDAHVDVRVQGTTEGQLALSNHATPSLKPFPGSHGSQDKAPGPSPGIQGFGSWPLHAHQPHLDRFPLL